MKAINVIALWFWLYDNKYYTVVVKFAMINLVYFFFKLWPILWIKMANSNGQEITL